MVGVLGSERRPWWGGETQPHLHEGPAEPGAQFPGAPGRRGETVGVGPGLEVCGAGVVQGELDGGVRHRDLSQSVLMGKVWV